MPGGGPGAPRTGLGALGRVSRGWVRSGRDVSTPSHLHTRAVRVSSVRVSIPVSLCQSLSEHPNLPKAGGCPLSRARLGPPRVFRHRALFVCLIKAGLDELPPARLPWAAPRKVLIALDGGSGRARSPKSGSLIKTPA